MKYLIVVLVSLGAGEVRVLVKPRGKPGGGV
jgi:hypothetical protein